MKLNPIASYLITAVAIVLALFFLFPISERHSIDPYAPIVFLAGSLLGAFFLTRIGDRRTARMYSLIPLFSLFAFLEEIGYGAEWGLISPLFRVGNSDEGFTDLHSVAEALLNKLGASTSNSIYFLLLFVGSLLIATVVIYIRRRSSAKETGTKQLQSLSKFFQMHPAFLFFSLALAQIFVAQLLDTGDFPIVDTIENFINQLFNVAYHDDLGGWVEEIFEFAAAVQLAYAAFLFPQKKDADGK